MMKYLRYAWYVIKHRWFVFVECSRNHQIWLGILHDWSKFLPSEFIPYARHFYGKGSNGIKTGRDKTGYYKPTDTGDDAFDFAWMLHQKRNKHHWQWWTLPGEEGIRGLKVLEVPERYMIEMLCDWRGASRAQGHGGDITKWWEANNHKLQLHPKTRSLVEKKIL